MSCGLHSLAQDNTTLVLWHADGTTTDVELNLRQRIEFTGDKVKGNITCPDGNHPHAIDLGLPTGTKWACCNVGASSPEGYGGYYAWGETCEKEKYKWENYEFLDSTKRDVEDIGFDIAGTSYDVAHVNLGGSWRMPSLEQIKELLDNCTSEWISFNVVIGREFTGPNGGKVFLPAGGYCWNTLSLRGRAGCYWSSTKDPDDIVVGSYGIFFEFDDVRMSSATLCSGLSVRPVSK